MAGSSKVSHSKKRDYQITSDGRVKVRASTLLADAKVQAFYQSLKESAAKKRSRVLPTNLLLLPLLGGFWFVHFCYLFKFRAQRLDGYRLLLESAFLGLLLIL